MAKKGKAKVKQVLKRIGDKKHVVDLTHYKKAVSAAGNASLDSGDEMAVALRGADLDDVYSKAAKLLREPVAALKRKYSHLNPGMQRMNLGNRMRGAQA